MRKVKIYLASSSEGLLRDKVELGAFIDDLNDRYEPYNIYFKMIMDDDCEREAIRDETDQSELFYILFGKNADLRAIEAFDNALSAYAKQKRPKITTYFKKLETGTPERSVLDFMQRLDGELGHYYSNYASTDAIKLNLLLQIKSLGLDAMPQESPGVEVGELIILDNIPLFSNNKRLSEMKCEAAELEREFLRLQQKVRQNPDDKEMQEAYYRISEQRNRSREATRKLQSDIFEMEKSYLRKVCSNGVTARQRTARKCLEEGDISGALQILDALDIQSEQDSVIKKLNLCRQELRMRADEWLRRAEILRLDTSDFNRFAAIEASYEQAIKLERECGLERTAEPLYADYLCRQNAFEKASQVIGPYIHFINSESPEDTLLYDALTLHGHIQMGLKNYRAAEDCFERALKSAEHMDLDEDRKMLHMAFAYKNLANACDKMSVRNDHLISANTLFETLSQWYPYIEKCLFGQYYLSVIADEDKDALHSMESIYDQLLRESGGANDDTQLEISSFSQKMGMAYDTMGKYAHAEMCYRRSLHILEQLAEQNPAAYNADLAAACKNFASFYDILKKPEDTERLILRSIEIQERIVGQNSDPEFLVNTYARLADFYKKMNRADEEEAARKHMAQLYLEMETPLYKVDEFAVAFYSLAYYFRLRKCPEEMETLIHRALPLYETMILGECNTNYYTPFWRHANDYAELTGFLADKYIKTGMTDAAITLREHAAAFWVRATEASPGYFEKTAISGHCELAKLYESANRPLLSAEQYQRALSLKNVPPAGEVADTHRTAVNFTEIQFKLARAYADAKEYGKAEQLLVQLIAEQDSVSPEVQKRGESRKAAICILLADTYMKLERYHESETLYNRALEIRQRRAKENSLCVGEVGNVLNGLSKLYESTGRLKTAVEYLSRAYEVWSEAAESEPMYKDILSRTRDRLIELKHREAHEDEAR